MREWWPAGANGAGPVADNPAMAKPIPRLTPAEIAQVVEIAWHAPSPFQSLLHSHGLSPGEIVQLLKRELTPNAFKQWMARTKGPLQAGKGVARRQPARGGR